MGNRILELEQNISWQIKQRRIIRPWSCLHRQWILSVCQKKRIHQGCFRDTAYNRPDNQPPLSMVNMCSKLIGAYNAPWIHIRILYYLMHGKPIRADIRQRTGSAHFRQLFPTCNRISFHASGPKYSKPVQLHLVWRTDLDKYRTGCCLHNTAAVCCVSTKLSDKYKSWTTSPAVGSTGSMLRSRLKAVCIPLLITGRRAKVALL